MDCLYERYLENVTVPKISRKELRIWYDGYYTATGIKLYNPRSVVLALTDNQLRNYWTSSGPYDELFYYVRNNIEEVKDDSLGYVYNLARKSEQMLQATIAGDTKMMEEILQYAHNTEAPIFSYNNEVELSAVVNLCYLSARNMYWVEREDKTGKGFVDFIFYPERKKGDCIILELKVYSTPEEAIAQIKNKEYALRFKGKPGEKPRYKGRIIEVGISYSRKTKEHHCKIEVIEAI